MDQHRSLRGGRSHGRRRATSFLLLALLTAPLAGTLVAGSPAEADVAVGEIIDLGTLGGADSYASDINDHGIVVGSSTGPYPSYLEPFAYDLSSGTMRQLDVPSVQGSTATAINNAGVVVGDRLVDAFGRTRAFAYDLTTDAMTDVGTLGGSYSVATDINDAGIVVGHSAGPSDTDTRAFVYDLATGTMTDVGPPGFAKAVAVNDEGLVLGHDGTTGSDAWIYDVITGELTTLGTFGVGMMRVHDINDAGVILGCGRRAGETVGRPFTVDLETGTPTFLPLLDGRATCAHDLNDSGVAVGTAFTPPEVGYVEIAVAFDLADGTVTQVATSALATASNDRGWMVGSVTDPETFESHAFAAPMGFAPDPPRELEATAGCTSVDLAWSAPATPGDPEFTEYAILRDGDEIATVDASTTAYTDDDTGGDVHTYTVVARSELATGPPSDTVTAAPPDDCAPVPPPPAEPQPVPADLTG